MKMSVDQQNILYSAISIHVFYVFSTKQQIIFAAALEALLSQIRAVSMWACHHANMLTVNANLLIKQVHCFTSLV